MASIHRARKTDRVSIDDVLVQAKITALRHMDQSEVDDLVQKISLYANTQNRVSEADFSANDPFHVQIEKLASMGQMAAGTAHHLNTPLAAMLLRVQMMRDAPSGASESDLEQLESGIAFCQNFVRRLLDFARRPAGEKQPQRLAPVLESVANFLAPSFAGRRAKVSLDLARAEEAEVLADRNLLEALFSILLSNSVDAVAPGGTIAIRCGPPRVERIELEIEDDGCGIDPAQLEHAFEPFFTTKGPGKGTGLGLAIARNILLEVGGSIRLESAPGKGTKATIELPLYRRAAATQASVS
jgi:two-component system NtrC family sensor kinase